MNYNNITYLFKKSQLLSLFLIIFSMKLWLIKNVGSDVPYWDQWDAEAAYLYKPYLEGKYNWIDLFSPHNEHRIAVTRLYSIILLELNGFWEPKIQMVINALIHSTFAICIFRYLVNKKSQLFSGILFILFIFIFSFPFSWENTIAGFQSQFYFLILFTLLSILFLSERKNKKSFLVGIVFLFLANISLSSGFVLSLALITVYLFKILIGDDKKQKNIIFIIFYGLIFVGGWKTLHHVQGHGYLKSKNTFDFLVALFKNLNWPYIYHVKFYLILLIVPFFIIIFRFYRYRLEYRIVENDFFYLTMSVWLIIQSSALAYGRGGTGADPASRYLDIISLNVLIGFLGYWKLLSDIKLKLNSKVFYLLLQVLFVIFVFMFVYGVIRYTKEKTIPELYMKSYNNHQQYKNVVGYLNTNDITYLKNKPDQHIPYPNWKRLKTCLDDKTLRNIFPYNIRKYIISKENGVIKKKIDKGRLYFQILSLINNWKNVLILGIFLLFLNYSFQFYQLFIRKRLS